MSIFSKIFKKDPAQLSKQEVELLNILRLSPETPVDGRELNLANSLVTRGFLRKLGQKRFLLTEKAMIAYRKVRS